MDEFGNTSTLSVAQQQYFISLAKSLGASQADIDSFIHNNGANDLGRIVSALGLSATATPSTQPGAGAGTTSYVEQIYATPTPLAGNDATVASPSDATITAAALVASGGGAAAPDVNVSVSPAGAGAVTVLGPASSSGIPTWAIIAAAAVLLLIFMERRS